MIFTSYMLPAIFVNHLNQHQSRSHDRVLLLTNQNVIEDVITALGISAFWRHDGKTFILVNGCYQSLEFRGYIGLTPPFRVQQETELSFSLRVETLHELASLRLKKIISQASYTRD